MSGATVHAFPAKPERYQSTAARTAKAIRLTLGKAFPGTKFRVVSESYSGGNSVNVYWVDGPTGEMVESFAARYQHSGFDGMTDSSYSIADIGDELGNPIPDRVRFVFCNRSLSQLFAQFVADAYNERFRPDVPLIVCTSDRGRAWLSGHYDDERRAGWFINALPHSSKRTTLEAWALEAWGSR